MMFQALWTVLSLLCLSPGHSFQGPLSPSSRQSSAVFGVSPDNEDGSFSRRDLFQVIGQTVASVGTLATLGLPQASWASDDKVLVLGGTGFVGSRVVKKLKELGVDVIATSRDGRDGTIAFDVTTTGDVKGTVESLSKGCTAVISTIGAIGTKDDAVVNSGSGLAAFGAKAAGVERFVYISVAPEVKEFAKDIEFLKDYMTGKSFSEDAITSSFGSKSTTIQPTFIHGGDEFKLNPPRVAGFYGEFIETLLSSGPIRTVASVAPEGFIKIALEPPVSVDAVAKAAIAGALGKAQPILDTYDKINQAGSGI